MRTRGQTAVVRRAVAWTGASVLAIGSALASTSTVHGFEFDWGEIDGAFDTTVSVGATFRVVDRDSSLVGQANGGTHTSINGDDGNLNYDQGLTSLAGRVTHELTLDYANIGFFGRATYFYDIMNADGDTEFRDLSSEAQQAVGRDIDLLDAYAYGFFDLGETPVDVRLGNQVISWGESTFIQNGINVINPVDVSAIRVPGSQLREALTPILAANVNVGITDNLSVEGFYQFLWEETEPDPAGTFFSTNDFATDGGDRQGVYLGFGNPLVPDNGVSVVTPVTPFGSRVQRGPDNEADDGGQFGIAARYFAPELNDTEFGAYFINYHSRLPLISAELGSFTDLAGVTAANYADGSRYIVEYPEDIQLYGVSFNTSVGNTGLSIQGEYSFKRDQPLQVDDVELLQAALAPAGVIGGGLQGQAQAEASVINGVIGVGATSTSYAGLTAPEQAAIDGALAAGLVTGFPAGSTIATVRTAGNTAGTLAAAALFNTNQVLQDEGIQFSTTNAAAAQATANSLFGSNLEGYREFNVSQAQLTATQAFGPIPAVGVDQWVLVGEVGGTYVHDFPGKSELRFDGPNTTLGGNPNFIGVGGMPTVQDGGFATQFSWGYRAALRFDMLNAIGPVNLFPTIGWQHDVHGTTPSPIVNFVEDRAAISLGLNATYLDAWSGGIQYTNFFAIGDDEFNTVRDRDFVSMNVRYAF